MRTAALIALALGLASLASAQTAVPTTDRGEVLIEYTSPTQLSNSFLVMRIRIANRSGEDRTWSFEFNAIDAGSVDSGRRSRFDLEVENGHDREFEILVPLAETRGNASWVQMFSFGYGLVNPGQMEVLASTVSSRVAVSAGAVLELPEVRDQLTADPAGGGNVVLPLTADALASDWRAYTGLATLWLSADEWKTAGASVRRAVTEWIDVGGHLVVVEPGVELREDPIERHGMGAIVTVPEGLSPAGASRVSRAIPRDVNAADSISWVSSLVDPIETRKGLLSLILLGYLVLAGPVNLFVLSPKAKRMRLFWTMPGIALGTSAVMAIIILIQDGVGGEGYRANFVYLEPELNRELIVQEQVSKTGALVRRSFEFEEEVVMKSLPTAYHPFQKPSQLATNGFRYHGDWFKSRSIQAHRLEYARSSRARIELAGSHEHRPTILSSIDVALDELYFRDEQGRMWYGENVLPGRPLSLVASSEEAYEQFYYRSAFTTAGPTIRARVGAVRSLPGTFVALAADGDTGVAVETLGSIDWNDGPVLYAGPVAR